MDGAKDIRARGFDEIRYVMQSWAKSFSLDYKNLPSYIGVWKKLLFLCWRLFNTKHYHGQFTTDKRQQLQRLSELDDEPSEQEVDQIILVLCTSLIQHLDFNPDGVRSIIKFFIGVMGYDLGKGRWKGPGDVTGTLAGLQFGIRVIGLESCIPQESRDDFRVCFPEENPEEKFKTELSCHLAGPRRWPAYVVRPQTPQLRD